MRLALAFFVTACNTRSISDSGPYGGNRGRHYYGWGDPVGAYRGELSEFDVLGIDRSKDISEAEIAAALKSPRTEARLTRASKILLIQSGANMPDEAMYSAMRAHFNVAPFSGKPATPPAMKATPTDQNTIVATHIDPQQASYAKSLRLTAARGGYDKIVCYWGQLESGEVDQATKIVSWVPIVGQMIPDKKHNMRIVLRAAIIDVASAEWTFVMPPPVMSSTLSTWSGRENADQVLVNRLKTKSYQDLAEMLFNNYTD